MTANESGTVACALVIYVCELARTARFYREVLGLEVADEADTFQVLTGKGLELVIHQVPPEIAVDIHIERPPALREDTPIKPVFPVQDFEALRAAILATEGGLEEEEATWSWRGYHIIDGWDPEGNILQFRRRESVNHKMGTGGHRMIHEEPMEDSPSEGNKAGQPDCSLVHSRLIAAGAGRVFQAFRDGEQLARWFGPQGFHNRIESLDFREGGDWHVVMVGPDGTEYPNQWRFLKIEEEQRILLEHLGGMHHFLLDITLEPRGDTTVVHWVQTFDSEQEKQTLAPFVESANEQNLERLEALVGGRSGSTGA